MVNIESYLEDGANWQAKAVLAYLKTQVFRISDEFYNERDKYHIEVKVGRIENCREQGYVVTLFVNYHQMMNYAFYEHRNSDRIVVFKRDGLTINTPSISFIYREGCDDERGKYDYDKSFDYGKITECGDWIIEDMIKIVTEKYNLK